ncbi:MAG: alpha-amylase family glycosyl hydrolase [Candidatus Helarchaeota archaeon]
MVTLDYVPEWAKKAVFYHIYPLGFFDAPKRNKAEQAPANRLVKLRDYYEYFQRLGVTAIQFGPLFEAVSHGYDTIDYLQIDRRLGTNALFRQIVSELHELGIRVIIDGVFNHVSREFESFKDIQKYREGSWRKHWHFIDFSGNNPYDDGFDYANWEGHYELVKLNLSERDVRDFIFKVVEFWFHEADIDGWRLDVAYQISSDFWHEFRGVCKVCKPDSFLLGEMIHGPYSKWIGPTLLDAGTSYQVYKSTWSAFNSNNMHELKAVLERSFHPEWGLNKDILLMNFLGNHDTSRIRSILSDDRYLYPAFIFLFTMKGIPKIYYGDEIAVLGEVTAHSDEAVRQPLPPEREKWNSVSSSLFRHVQNLIAIRKRNPTLIYGDLLPIYAESNLLAFLRRVATQIILVIINNFNQQTTKRIPLWNQQLEGVRFKELLEQGGPQEFEVRNNQLILELYPCWGRILAQI